MSSPATWMTYMSAFFHTRLTSFAHSPKPTTVQTNSPSAIPRATCCPSATTQANLCQADHGSAQPSRECSNTFDEPLEELVGIHAYADVRVGFSAPPPRPVDDGHAAGQAPG